MKNCLLYFFVITCFLRSNAQEINKNTGVFQFGGQMIVSLHYERSLIQYKFGELKIGAGLGLNEFGDGELGLKPIYGFPINLTSVIGAPKVKLRTSLFPTVYLDDGFSFINLNAWVGIRFYPDPNVYFDFGYSPRLYTSITEPDIHTAFVPFGFGIGIKF